MKRTTDDIESHINRRIKLMNKNIGEDFSKLHENRKLTLRKEKINKHIEDSRKHKIEISLQIQSIERINEGLKNLSGEQLNDPDYLLKVANEIYNTFEHIVGLELKSIDTIYIFIVECLSKIKNNILLQIENNNNNSVSNDNLISYSNLIVKFILK
jgi:hypothetical protein